MPSEAPHEFRCTGCGAISRLHAPHGTLTLGRKRRACDAAAPPCPCGVKSWVLVGSTTEFYMYSRRDDVCRIGDHVAPRTRAFELYPRHPARGTSAAIARLHVNVCAAHVAELRAHGILGCFPEPQPAPAALSRRELRVLLVVVIAVVLLICLLAIVDALRARDVITAENESSRTLRLDISR